MANNVSDAELEHALKIAARVVVLYGDAYLPVFNRMHREFEVRKNAKEKENLAHQLARQYADIPQSH